jgi:Lipocalin-like domain
MYTQCGYMSAHLIIPGQPKFKVAEARESDRAEVGSQSFSYSGPYFVEEDGRKITLRHGMRIANRPEPRWKCGVESLELRSEGSSFGIGGGRTGELSGRDEEA